MKYMIFLIFVFALFLNSCSNKYFNLDNDIDNKVPAWFIDFKDEDEKNIYAIATSISPDMQLSLEKSKMLALNNIAQKLKGLLDSNFKVSSVNEKVITEGDVNIIVENFSTRGLANFLYLSYIYNESIVATIFCIRFFFFFVDLRKSFSSYFFFLRFVFNDKKHCIFPSSKVPTSPIIERFLEEEETLLDFRFNNFFPDTCCCCFFRSAFVLLPTIVDLKFIPSFDNFFFITTSSQ